MMVMMALAQCPWVTMSFKFWRMMPEMRRHTKPSKSSKLKGFQDALGGQSEVLRVLHNCSWRFGAVTDSWEKQICRFVKGQCHKGIVCNSRA
jgi:hypothetical protein